MREEETMELSREAPHDAGAAGTLVAPDVSAIDAPSCAQRRAAPRAGILEIGVAGRLITGVSMSDDARSIVGTCEMMGVNFSIPSSERWLIGTRPMRHVVDDGSRLIVPATARSRRDILAKRTIDVVVSAAALLVLSPLLAVVALLVVLTSRGPALFRQTRVGMHGRRFEMLKFRSMVADAEGMRSRLMSLNEQSGPVFKIRKDPRVTPIGRFIRKYSIDELPQLVNVLRGDMSLVGPRPPVPAEVARYEPWHMRRLSVPPGLTCTWQVSGRGSIGFDEWMRLDVQYVESWSIVDDIVLLLRTVPVVVMGSGAW